MKDRVRTLLTAFGLVVVALLSIATGKPKEEKRAVLDAETVKYVGDWEGDNVTLSIGQDRSVHYKKQDGNTSKSVDGTLKAIENNQIVVKAAFIEVKWKVNSPPTETDGMWAMTVDGMELAKKGAGAGRGASPKTKLEGSIATQFASKGVTKVVCPSPSGQAAFTCTATLKNGKTSPVEVTLKDAAKGNYGFTMNVLDVEPQVFAADLARMVEKETKGKLRLTVDCGAEKIYLPQKETFTCSATDAKTRKRGSIEATYTGSSLSWQVKGL